MHILQGDSKGVCENSGNDQGHLVERLTLTIFFCFGHLAEIGAKFLYYSKKHQILITYQKDLLTNITFLNSYITFCAHISLSRPILKKC